MSDSDCIRFEWREACAKADDHVKHATDQPPLTPAEIRDGERVHELKIWPEYLRPIIMGHKGYEVRKADRDYQVGDILHLREWEPGAEEYTGAELLVRVTHCCARPLMGVMPGFLIMSISPELHRREDGHA